MDRSEFGMSKVESRTFFNARCLNDITGHRSDILGVLKLTSISDSPEIFLMTFAQGEEAVYLTGVDDKAVRRVQSGRPIYIDYPRQGSTIVQIYAASAYDGVDLALLESDKINGGHQISLWTFK